MTDRPASWRMPTPKQMEKLAAAADRRNATPAVDAPQEMPAEYWESVLADPRVAAQHTSGVGQRCLSEIPQHVLRVTCRRCDRVVEIQKADAVRYYGKQATWRSVGQKLLDQTCQNRTGRHEEDGCWASFDTP